MNLKSLSALGAVAAIGFGAQAASALPLSDYDANVINIYFGGATATDNVLENVALAVDGGYCAPNTIDVYRTTNNRVVFCRVTGDQVPGFPAAPNGLKVAFHKESRGGSSNGVNPLIAVANGNAHSLRWLDLAQLLATQGSNPTSCPGVVQAGTASLRQFTLHNNCSELLTVADTAGSAGTAGRYDVNGGISDTEPALSFPAPSPTNIAKLSSVGGLGIVFGVPVTTNLYRALQVAQGLNTGACATTPDSASCVPSLTRSQVRGLYTASIIDWDSLTNGSGTPLSQIAGVTAPNTTDVFICRRVATSGTQASFESYFLNERCAAGSATFAAPDDGSGPADTVWVPANPNNGFVNAGPSSGNVRSCLATYGNATNNRWALGVLSTEVSAGNLTDGNFRMVKIDGAPPSLEATANGDYDFFTENTLNRVAAGNPGFIAASDSRAVLLAYIENNIGRPALIADLNSPFQNRPWGDGGVLAIPGGAIVANASPTTTAELRTNPVNTQSRFGNNCATPTTVVGQPVDNVTGPRY